MHLIITDAWLARTRAIHLSGVHLALASLALSLVLMLLAAGLYHWVFLKGAREGWPVIGALVRLVVQDDVAQRDRFMRENIDAMAKRLGDMQARMLELEALSDRVSGLAGLPVQDLKKNPGMGGALLGARALSSDQVQQMLDDLLTAYDQKTDYLTLVESRLLDQKLRSLMLPTQPPVPGSPLGSGFGWRLDPMTGQSAMHTGLDYQAQPGTPILAAAGGMVVLQEFHPAYGNLVEVDHGNDVLTRYAHASKVWVKRGDLVKRGQRIADVGSSGRSTGPHLHFEVLVRGIPQDPQRFLARTSSTVAAAVPPASARGGR